MADSAHPRLGPRARRASVDVGRDPVIGRGDPEWVYDAVERVKAGDRQALAELYNAFSRPVLASVRRILQDPYEAEDVTQQVFLKLMSVLPRYERRNVPFSAWLMRVARNVALDAERRRRPVQSDVSLHRIGSRPEPGQALQRLLLDAIDSLPMSQRRVVVMRHVVGMSATEVARELGRTTGSVHALDQRGRRALKRDLRSVGSAPATLAHHVG